MRLILNCLLLLLACRPAMAAENVTGFGLENGMQVVVIEDHRAPVVVQMVWYKAGAADEPKGKSGIAHFLEHLMFKGTETLAPGEFSSVVARHGGSDNAFTGQDYTAYHQRIAADQLSLVMEMESDRMINLQLGEQAISTERDVILEERAQRTESEPGALLNEQMEAAQYLNHPYGLPIIGWRHEMAQLGLQDALDFYKTFYAPNNAILVIAGDVTPEEVRALAEKHFAPIPANPDLPERRRPQEPPQNAARHIVLEDARVSQPYVTRSYLAPERDSGAQEQAAALKLLAELLGGDVTSVLTQKLEFDQSVAVYTGAHYAGSSLDDDSFNLTIVPAAGVSLDAAEQALDDTLAQFMAEGVNTAHLDRLKQQIRAAQIYAQDDVSDLANRYGRGLTQGLTIEDIEAWPDILSAVTEEDIMNAAKLVLRPENSVTGWLKAPEEKS